MIFACPSSTASACSRASILRRSAARFGLPHIDVPSDFFARLAAYSWPGDVRELENAIEALVALSGDGALDLSRLPSNTPAPAGEPETDAPLKQRVEAYERGLMVAALAVARQNRSEAARALGIGRATLHEKMIKYGLGKGEG